MTIGFGLATTTEWRKSTRTVAKCLYSEHPSADIENTMFIIQFFTLAHDAVSHFEWQNKQHSY